MVIPFLKTKKNDEKMVNFLEIFLGIIWNYSK